MIIKVNLVSKDGSRYTGEEPADYIDLKREDDVEVTGLVQYDLEANIVSQELIVQGTVSVPATQECGRCGVFFSTIFTDSAFLRAYELVSEHEEQVDISDDLREALILQIPDYPICSGDCKGRCSQCGKNLNENKCSCQPEEASGAWSELDDLNLDKRSG